MDSNSSFFLDLVDAMADYDARSTVCRNLFGPINHDLSHAFLKRQLSILMANSSKDWNFDFANELPRQGGRFAWEAVSRQAVRPTTNTVDEPTQTEQVPKFMSSSPGPSPCRNTRKGTLGKHKCQRKRLVQSSLKRFLPVRKHPAVKLQSNGYKKLAFRNLSKEARSPCTRCHGHSCGDRNVENEHREDKN